MVQGLTAYNMFLLEGWSAGFLLTLFKEVWLGFAIALLLDLFLVSKIAKPIAFHIIGKNNITSLPVKVVIISMLMITGMVLCMSLFGSVMAVGFSSKIADVYLEIALMNLLMAVPLNLLFANPVSRLIHLRIFPVAVR